MKMQIAVMTAGLTLAACTVSEPVVVIGKRGQVLTGSATAALSGGTFQVANARMSCGGNYDAMSTDPVLSFGATCSDGRQGIGSVVRDKALTSGRGTIRMSDGEEYQFIFGPEVTGHVASVGQ